MWTDGSRRMQAVVALHVLLIPAILADFSINEILLTVSDTTGLQLEHTYARQKDGLQDMYLHLLKAAHAHAAFPYHDGDTWGSGRGQLDRVSINAFLEKTRHHLRPRSRCLEWGIHYLSGEGFSSNCVEKWSFEYVSQGIEIDTDKRIIRGSLDASTPQQFHKMTGYFDAIVATQVFEHVADPFRSACNLETLLSRGGLVFFTVPFISRYHIGHISEDPHAPQDNYRYTIQGVRNLWRHTEGMEMVEQYASGRSLLTHAHLEGFGSHDFTQAQLADILYDAENITVGGQHGEEDLYYNVNILLRKTSQQHSQSVV